LSSRLDGKPKHDRHTDDYRCAAEVKLITTPRVARD